MRSGRRQPARIRAVGLSSAWGSRVPVLRFFFSVGRLGSTRCGGTHTTPLDSVLRWYCPSSTVLSSVVLRGACNRQRGRRRGQLRRCRLGPSRVRLTSCSSGYVSARHSQHPGSGTPFILASHTTKWHTISLYVPFYDVLFYADGCVFQDGFRNHSGHFRGVLSTRKPPGGARNSAAGGTFRGFQRDIF